MKLQYLMGCILAAGSLTVFPNIGLVHGGGGGGGHGFAGEVGGTPLWEEVVTPSVLHPSAKCLAASNAPD